MSPAADVVRAVEDVASVSQHRREALERILAVAHGHQLAFGALSSRDAEAATAMFALIGGLAQEGLEPA